jgi:hypothetical protein
MAAQWHYWASEARGIDALNKHMAEMAEAGWELVSTSSGIYYLGNSISVAVQSSYVTYWRKPAS